MCQHRTVLDSMKNIWDQIFPAVRRFKPRTFGWEARMLTLCYAIPLRCSWWRPWARRGMSRDTKVRTKGNQRLNLKRWDNKTTETKSQRIRTNQISKLLFMAPPTWRSSRQRGRSNKVVFRTSAAKLICSSSDLNKVFSQPVSTRAGLNFVILSSLDSNRGPADC